MISSLRSSWSRTLNVSHGSEDGRVSLLSVLVMGSAVLVRTREVLREGVSLEIERGILSVIRERSEGLVGTANRMGLFW